MLTVLLFVVAALNAVAAVGGGPGRPFALVAACAFMAAAVLRVSRRWWAGGLR